MKILVIKSSSHRPGTSDVLADKFIEGAKKANNNVSVFDASEHEVSPMQVNSDNSPISGNHAAEDILKYMLDAELIVFSTPLYYYGMSAQLKSVIDRMYEQNRALQGDKKSILLSSAYGSLDAFAALVAHYNMIYKYMRWTNLGTVLAENSYTVEALNETNFPEDAYQLGLSIH